MKTILFLVTFVVFSFCSIDVAAQSTALKNGEHRIELNGVSHWYKIAGAEHKTVPLVIVHGGPGGNVYNFERWEEILVNKNL